jgi:hypothetical protein
VAKQKEKEQCVALSSRDRASLNCSNAVACYMEGTKTVSDSKRNIMGVLKAYGGVEAHIHFILKSTLYGFQWLASRRNRFNAAEPLWAP